MQKTAQKNLFLDFQKGVKKYIDLERGKFLQRFFKTGKGEYAEGDIFLGIDVPTCRLIARQFQKLSLADLKKLLKSKFHEERLITLFILVLQFQKGDEARQEKIFNLYLAHTKWINNWDLVDSSAYHIVGAYLFERNRSILYRLAKSKSLWERRISIVSTFYFIRQKQFTDTLKVATMLLGDKHDLIHKAVGWMLREVGKKDEKTLVQFLEKNCTKMPRTSLRYSLERLSTKQKLIFMKK